MLVQERDRIRVLLLENSLSQVWLISRLEERGVITDKSELSSALSGSRKGKKVDIILKNSLDILDDYTAKMKRDG